MNSTSFKLWLDGSPLNLGLLVSYLSLKEGVQLQLLCNWTLDFEHSSDSLNSFFELDTLSEWKHDSLSFLQWCTKHKIKLKRLSVYIPELAIDELPAEEDFSKLPASQIKEIKRRELRKLNRAAASEDLILLDALKEYLVKYGASMLAISVIFPFLR